MTSGVKSLIPNRLRHGEVSAAIHARPQGSTRVVETFWRRVTANIRLPACSFSLDRFEAACGCSTSTTARPLRHRADRRAAGQVFRLSRFHKADAFRFCREPVNYSPTTIDAAKLTEIPLDYVVTDCAVDCH